jgi:hypothetical protein
METKINNPKIHYNVHNTNNVYKITHWHTLHFSLPVHQQELLILSTCSALLTSLTTTLCGICSIMVGTSRHCQLQCCSLHHYHQTQHILCMAHPLVLKPATFYTIQPKHILILSTAVDLTYEIKPP